MAPPSWPQMALKALRNETAKMAVAGSQENKISRFQGELLLCCFAALLLCCSAALLLWCFAALLLRRSAAREGILISWHPLGFMRCLDYDCNVDGNQHPQAAEFFTL